MAKELSALIQSLVPDFEKRFKLVRSEYNDASFGDSVAHYVGEGIQFRVSRDRGELIFEVRLDDPKALWKSPFKLPSSPVVLSPDEQEKQIEAVASMVMRDSKSIRAAL